jgi:hypothetical protein
LGISPISPRTKGKHALPGFGATEKRSTLVVLCPIAVFPATSEREKIDLHQTNKDTGHHAVILAGECRAWPLVLLCLGLSQAIRSPRYVLVRSLVKETYSAYAEIR